MKKVAVLVTVLLLLAIPLGPAWASEMYDTYGPMYEWTDEQWQACDSWSDEEWEDYWQGESEAYELSYVQEKYDHKVELGCPDPDGLNIKLNENYLKFTGAQPQMVDGGVYLPLRGFFAAVGIKATVEYSNEDGLTTATLPDGSTLAFCSGDEELLLTRADGETEELYTYYPPLLLNGSMYVEEWELNSFMGWDSYWDYHYEILYIVNPEPLITAIDSNFTTINHLFTLSAAQDMSQPYQVTANMALTGTLYGDQKDDVISASISYEGLRRGTDLDLSFALKMDLSQMKDSIFSGLPAETWDTIKAVSSAKGRLIFNSEESVYYLQGTLLPLLDKRLSAGDWLKMEMPFSMDSIEDLLPQLSLGHLIYQSSADSYYYGDQDVYAQTLKNVATWQALLGDDCFNQQNSGGYQVYSLKPEAQKGPIPGLSAPSADLYSLLYGYGYGYGEEKPLDLKRQLSFREKDGLLHDLELKASLNTGGTIPVYLNLELSGSQTKGKAKLEIIGRYFGKLLLTMDSSATPTEKLPASAPPQGSKVVDMMSLFGYHNVY